MRNNLQELQPKLKAFSIYQIIGGLIGLGSIAYLIATTDPLPILLLLILSFPVLLYGYSIYCGIVLSKRSLSGLKYSKINQLLQVVHFTLFGYSFQYVSGVHFSPGLDLTKFLNFKLNLSLSTWQININTGEPDMLISLNVVALFLIVFIDKAMDQLKEAELEAQVVQIGLNEQAKQLT
jgi:ammonia channel protein AmtB